MPQVRQVQEHPIQLDDYYDFVTMQDVGEKERHEPAVTVEGIDNYVIGVERGTVFAPEFRDSNGDPLDGSTRYLFQKADPQGNPLGGFIIAEGTLSDFNYERMRSDEDYMRFTRKSLMLDEKESLYVYVVTPKGANTFSADESRLTIGDPATDLGKPAFIRNKTTMTQEELAAVQRAASGR